jgi:hypothetical protein
MIAVIAVSLATLQIHIGVAKMFLFNLQAPLVFIAVFSIPALLLELQLLVIGLNGMSVNVMIATVAIGLVSAIGAIVIEAIEG